MKRVFTIISAILLTFCFAAEAYAQTNWTSTQSEGGVLSGNFILQSDVTLKKTITINNGASLTIDLNGHTITFPSGQGRVFLCNKEGELTIKDSSTDKKGVITGGLGDRGGFLYLIGKFNFLGGTIQNAHATFNAAEGYNYENAFTNGVGGAVYVQYGAEFIMDGGNIVNCSAYGYKDNADINGKYYSQDGIGWMPHMGGAVFVNALEGKGGKFHFKSGTIRDCFSGVGGAVCVHVAQSSNAAAGSAGEFMMDGGEITNCWCDYAYLSYVYGGGAVFVAGKISNQLAAKFTMNGGTISGCTSASHGGGIKSQGIVEMHGGTIKNCKCVSGGQRFGGGVHVYQEMASFTMTGGTISNCAASSGGGVMVWGDNDTGKPIFIMDGDTATTKITGCTAIVGNGNGGAVYVQQSTFNFKNGTLSGNEAWRYGGAININETAILTLEGNCKIQGNKAGAGGGISQEAGGCEIEIDNDGVLIEGNEAIYQQANKDKLESVKTACGQGGGILIEKGTFKMSKGIIRDNYASHNGGGVACYVSRIVADVTAEITGGEISGNSAGVSGGGIDLYASNSKVANGVDVKLTGGILHSNSAKNGGGIYVGIYTENNTATMTINLSYTESTIYGNTATENGGAIGLNNGTVTVTSGNFTNNTAGRGGAIYLGTGNMSMNNVFIHENTATISGGGVYLANGKLKIEDSDNNKINSNTANSTATSTGGGIHIQNGELEMTKCLVQENTATYGGGVCVSNKNTTTIDLLNSAITFEKNTATTAGGGMAVLGPITLNFAGSFQYNSANNAGGILVAQGATLNYKGGMIRYNHATGTSTGINTGYMGTADGIHGFGGGVFVGANSKLLFDVTDGGLGFYGNDANTGGDDIFANGVSTEVLLPVVGVMELTGFDIPVAKNGMFWVEDYMTGDVNYNLGPHILGDSHSPIRYQDALKSAAVIGKLADDAADYKANRYKYLSLALGYELLFVRINKQGLDPGDAAIVNISYSKNGEISSTDWVPYQKALLVGPTSGDASVYVALPPNAWKFEEETTWSANYTATKPIETRKFENQQTATDNPVIFINTKKDKEQITVHDEANVENRMSPTS